MEVFSSSFSSSSSSFSRFKYDVFLSFRGKDFRKTFTSHVVGAFEREKLTFFIDCKLNRGYEIASSLLKAIEESKILVVIFSENYADSKWCLDELVKIHECRKMYGQIVIPIFYEVTPSDVRHQTGAFGNGFARLQRRFLDNPDKLERWKDSLTQLPDIHGWHKNSSSNEYTFVVEISKDIRKKLNDMPSSFLSNEYKLNVKDIPKKLNDMPSSCKENFVGAERKIKEIESLLSLGLNTVIIVGIWGMGGFGKTTLARAVFDNISDQFEGYYFINVSENFRDCGKTNWFQRNKFSTEMLCHKKLLFVLDNVSSRREIDFLIGLYDSLNFGSRIIIISRDLQLLKNCGANELYEAYGLFYDEALILFSLYAFKQNQPTEDYMQLSLKLLDYARGCPLALKVLGSSLYGKSQQVWITALYRIKSAGWGIFDVLKVSYDGLGDEEKKIFLDIACFFAGEHKDYVEIFLNSKGISTTGITVLMNKSLITISNNKIVMHDLIQEMGLQIAYQEYFITRKHSFLWHHEDIGFVLRKDNRGTVSLAGISLDISKIRCMHLNPYSRMSILEFFSSHVANDNKVHPFQGLESTFSELRYFHLHGNPLKSSSSNFHPESLFEFDMPYSNFGQLWNADQAANFQRLHLENRPQKALYLGQRKRKLNSTIEMFSTLVDRCVKQNTSIEVDHGDVMYGRQSVTFVTSKDCHIMISMTELTVSCIDIYIRMLYEQLKDYDMLGQFGFINPVSVSPVDVLKYRCERGRVIARCLQRATPTQLIFMPYNHGYHWILVVIDMKSMKIYYSDSLGGSMDGFLMNIMQIGLNFYHSHNGNQSDDGVVQWERVKVPMQSVDVECGYYVLRFMKDIIADRSVLTENFHGKRIYTQEEIDEVRNEWTIFFKKYL